MHRLPIALALFAILGAASSAVLYFRIGDSKKLLEVQLAGATARTVRLESDLAATNEQNGTLKANLATANADLEATREKLTASELRATVLDHDLAKTKNLLALQEQNARALAAEVTSLRTDLDDARNSNASPEAVAAYKNTISELERQLANARNGAAAPTAAGASTAVFSSRPGRATVLTVGPQSAFVVLNFGSTRGAKIGQKLEVSQGTQIVATVLVSDVRTNFSVAQVQPDTLRGVLQKGDSALLVR
jgi:septal ring factor EnvC (AmiA/AmiB activator)